MGYTDADYMKSALEQARLAGEMGEVPIGCVIVWDDGRIVGTGHNTRQTEKCALGHAECNAIAQACHTLGGWRLHKATLYVTTEPCPMCAGAIMNARIARVVYGCEDAKAGAYGSVFDLNNFPVNHKPSVTKGVLAEECGMLLSDFFKTLRANREKAGETQNRA